jgi:hypothetical protein
MLVRWLNGVTQRILGISETVEEDEHPTLTSGFVDFVWRPLALRALDRVGKKEEPSRTQGLT